MARRKNLNRHRRLRKAMGRLIAGLAALLLLSLVIALSLDHTVARSAVNRLHTGLDDVPPHDIALVLGTAKYARGGLNVFYTRRIQAAADLFHAGKVRGILVSGDNGRKGYDEPTAMREDLIAAGVPAEAITRDFAGFRTLDSVIRAREVFGLESAIVVSQRFHCERAIYLGSAHGLELVGYCAEDAPARWHLRVRARETAARTKAWLDVHILGKSPRFLGERETVWMIGAAAD